jgi:hypothetical protein
MATTGFVIGVAVGPDRRWRGRGFDATSYMCMTLGAAVFIASAVQVFVAVRNIVRIARGDLRPGTKFFHAADRQPGLRVDPVKSIEVRRAPLSITFRRPYVLRITTRLAHQHVDLLSGRPVEELEAVAEELRSLLRLDAAPSKGFAVVPIGEKM